MKDFTFATIVLELYNSYSPRNERRSRIKFFSLLFHEYFSSSLIANSFSDSYIHKQFANTRPLSKQIKTFYSNSPKNQEALRQKISNMINTEVLNPDYAISELINILRCDDYFTSYEKDTIFSAIPQQANDNDGKANLIAKMIFLSFSRPEEELLTDGAPKSPSLKNKLKNTPPSPTNLFTGRDKELERLHKEIIKHKKVLICGPAGIGKSELALKYASKHITKYRNIVYIYYSGDLEKDITNLRFVDDINLLDERKRFEDHERTLKNLESDSLIIVDNFNSAEHDDEYFHTLMQYSASILVTTRCKYPEYKHIYLKALKKKELLSIVERITGKLYGEDKKHVYGIINCFDRNTFLVILAARLLSSEIENNTSEKKLTARKLYTEIKKNAGYDLPHRFQIFKDRTPSYNKFCNHVRLIFSIADFDSDEILILQNLSVLTNIGIEKNLLLYLLDCETPNDIIRLINRGFVESYSDPGDDTQSRIRIPSPLQKVSVAELKPTTEDCDMLIDNIAMYCSSAAQNPGSITINDLQGTIYSIFENVIINDNRFFVGFLSHAINYLLTLNIDKKTKPLVSKMEDILAQNPELRNEYGPQLYSYKSHFATRDDEIADYCYAAIDLIPEVSADNIDKYLVAEYNIAVHHLNTYSFKEAQEHFKKCIDVANKHNKENILEAINANYYYASLLYRSGNYNSARSHLHNAKELLCKDHPHCIIEIARVVELLVYCELQLRNISSGADYLGELTKLYKSNPQICTTEQLVRIQLLLTQILKTYSPDDMLELKQAFLSTPPIQSHNKLDTSPAK